MKILILSFYYYPDLCAGSFRCTALVEQLRRSVDSDVEIEVITTRPNRYASFQVDAVEFEKKEGFSIRRIALPSHRSGMLDQAKAFFHFAKEVNRLVKQRDYALVFATSSRLMTAVLGAWVARKKKAILYLDIRDLFVDTLNEVLPVQIRFWSKPVFSFLERWTFIQAKRINFVSKGFFEYFSARYSCANVSWFTNGIDTAFLGKQIAISPSQHNNSVTILYAGNIGEGQGLHSIVPFLAKELEGRAHFKVIGDGGRIAPLLAALKENHCSCVEVLPPMNRDQLIDEYQKADILFLHLNDYDAFRKVLPSKLFEYAAMGKPILAGVSGYCADFIKAEIRNAAVFKPCNVTEAVMAFSTLNLETQPRNSFIKKYARAPIMKAMVDDILSCL